MDVHIIKNIPRRFWAFLIGFVVITTCLMLDWVEITNSTRAAQVRPGQGEMTTLFSLMSRPESDAIRTTLLIMIVVSIISIFAIAVSGILVATKRYDSSGTQKTLAVYGFGFAAIIPLIFAIFAASISDPALLRLTITPIVQVVAALTAMVFTVEKLNNAIRKNWQLYILLLPAFALVFVFTYLPMYGIQIAFRDFKAAFGIAGSEWVGMKNFTDFFSSFYSTRLIMNTFLLNVYGLVWAFPIPIIMALFLNQLPWKRYKRFTQTVIYAPHFISPVVMVGIIFLLLSPTSGLVNRLIESAGGTSIAFMLEASWFRTIFISTDIWQHSGWNTILYIAALTAIDPGLYEAAKIDGASKWQQIRHIDIPHMMPIIIMLFILNCGAMLTSNTDKALLMQTDANIPTSDIIGLYVYRMGIQAGQFSFTAAINLLVNVINFVMIISVNWIARRSKQASLF